MMNKKPLAGLLPEEITQFFSLQQKFQGTQIFEWVSKGVTSFEQMTNVSKSIRSKLNETAVLRSSAVAKNLQDDDGTVKLQIKLHDGNYVETVLLLDRNGRKTACVSSQAGCPLACAFCKTGSLGFSRNLEAAEIVEQFLFLEAECGKLDNIVFMGMGEPLLNLENVLKAIAILTHKKGRNLSARRITISTSGLVKKIYELSENTPPLRLALSLTTADEELRKELMPVAKENSLADLRNAIKAYAEKTGKRVTLEAALLGGKNSSREQAEKLAEFAKGTGANVNVIPWNKIDSLPFEEPSKREVSDFMAVLEKNGINATIRTKRGTKIGGACGQLGELRIDNL